MRTKHRPMSLHNGRKNAHICERGACVLFCRYLKVALQIASSCACTSATAIAIAIATETCLVSSPFIVYLPVMNDHPAYIGEDLFYTPPPSPPPPPLQQQQLQQQQQQQRRLAAAAPLQTSHVCKNGPILTTLIESAVMLTLAALVKVTLWGIVHFGVPSSHRMSLLAQVA